jgi:hypothetical protein
LPEPIRDTTLNIKSEIDMSRNTGNTRLWAEVDFADLLSPAAVGASFEGLADFLISGIADTRARSGSVVRNDCVRETE